MKFLNMEEFIRNLDPVTSTEYLSKNGEFNPNGLFSEEIFGPISSNERSKTFSYINLFSEVLHPEGYKIIKQLDRKIENLLSTESSYSIDSQGNLYVDEENGKSGISSFKEMFPNLSFRGGTSKRDKLIEQIKNAYNKGLLFIEYLPITPPDVRPMYQDENGEWIIDSLNDVYISIMRKAFQVSNTGSGPLYDLLNYEVQNAILKHDDYIRTKLNKKEGAIRSSVLGKRVDYTGRAVVTPAPDLEPREIGIPCRMAVKMFEPFIIHTLLKTDKINQDELSKEVQNYLKTEVNPDSIQKVLKDIKNQDKVPKNLYNIIWEATEIAMYDRVVICKRDPVLHAQSVQGFNPKLVSGSTIQFSTLDISQLNMDFDGDCVESKICIFDNNNNILLECNISELQYKNNLFKKKFTERKGNKIIEKYKPLIDLKIQSINTTRGDVSYNKITEYSIHKNLDMFKISNKNFEDFWCSSDHSLIIFDKNQSCIRKATPLELKKNPENKYLLKGVNKGE